MQALLSRRLTPAVLTALVLLAAVGAAPLRADDYPVFEGRVYTQTAGDGAPPRAGYLVSDRDQIPFWTEFRNRGGVYALGYPITQRFEWDGFLCQGFQKAILQWRPDTRTFDFINVFDRLSEEGYDDRLSALLVPPYESFEETDLDWPTIVERRLGLLADSPPLQAAYHGHHDPMRWYGLPTSHVVRYADVHAIRLQRAVLQLWLVDLPWARAGEVTVANGADLAKQVGLLPANALAVVQPDPSDDPIVIAVNEARATLGLPPLAKSPELMQAAQSHADYYVRNLGDPNSGGLHTEVPGKPGFTGRRIFDRAKAAGYPLDWIDETFGFLDPARTLDWALGTVFHRYMFVHPSAAHVGYGTASAGRTTATVFNVGLSPEHTAPVPLPSVYPADGARGVPTVWDGAESPDPAPGVPRPLGPPITLQFGLDDRVAWTGASLHDQAGQTVPAVTSTSEWRRAIALIPRDPLRPATVYTVVATGLRNGTPFEFRSGFTTR